MLWRTTGLWGTGLGRDLNPDEIDGNFFEIQQAVDAIQAIGGINSIDDFELVGDQLTVLMTDHTTRGPFTLPSASWNDTGAWQPNFVYSLRDTFSINGTVYEVIFAHTSAASFDAGANNGSGSDYYHAMISSPDNTLPEGGVVPMVLKKFSASDFETIFGYVAMDELEDVTLLSPLIDGQALVWDDGLGKWVNVTQVPQDLEDIGGVLGYGKTLREQLQVVTSSAGVLSLDFALGGVCRLTMTENITQINLVNSDDVSSIDLFIMNPDAFAITSLDYWDYALWEAGTPPPVVHILWVEYNFVIAGAVTIAQIKFAT